MSTIASINIWNQNKFLNINRLVSVEKNGKRSFPLRCWKYKFYDVDDAIDRSEVFVNYWSNIILRDKFAICETCIWERLNQILEDSRTLVVPCKMHIFLIWYHHLGIHAIIFKIKYIYFRSNVY